jgi:hypothetical protein
MSGKWTPAPRQHDRGKQASKGPGGKVTGSLGDPTSQVKKTRESIYANKASLGGTGEKEKLLSEK